MSININDLREHVEEMREVQNQPETESNAVDALEALNNIEANDAMDVIEPTESLTPEELETTELTVQEVRNMVADMSPTQPRVTATSTNSIGNITTSITTDATGEVTYVDPYPKAQAEPTPKKAEIFSREETPDVHDISIDHEDLVILELSQMLLSDDKRYRLFTTDWTTKKKFVEIRYAEELRGKCNNRRRELRNRFLFDKNMNPLILSYKSSIKDVSKMFPRVNYCEGSLSIPDINTSKWIVVDKKRFLESKGKDFVIKYRVGYNPQEALSIKKEFVESFRQIKNFINSLKRTIRKVYDQENFEIIYEFVYSHKSSNKNNFYIVTQLHDVTITNSIEVTHKIHNMFTRFKCYHRSDDNTFKIRGTGMYGIRTLFNPTDMVAGYSHSHLSGSESSSWAKFCMGKNHFLSYVTERVLTPLEFESTLIGILDHVSWESLEGGPYRNMENIGKESHNEYCPNYRITNSPYVWDTHQEVFNLLNTRDMSSLKECYSLVKKKNGGVSYIINRRRFYEKFIYLFTDEEIQKLLNKYGYNHFTYAKNKKCFYSLNGKAALNREDMIRKARLSVSKIEPIYINGRYVRPQLTELNENMQFLDGKLTFHPNLIIYIGMIIQYKLNNALKNVNR